MEAPKIIKKNGDLQDFDEKKITERLNRLISIRPCLRAELLDIASIVQKVIRQLHDNIVTNDIDKLMAETCHYLSMQEPEYDLLAARVHVSALHKHRGTNYFAKVKLCFENKDAETNEPYPLVSKLYFDLVKKYADEYQKIIDYRRDYSYDYFGLRTLYQAYLLKEGGFKAPESKIIESPQDMIMRYCVFLHRDNIEQVKQCYDLMSQHFFIAATPSLFNAGTQLAQMSSCFLLQIPEDSLDSIFDTVKECAMIAKSSGGIGLSIHRIRATDSNIKTTNGVSNGIVPMLRVYNDTAFYVDQCFEPSTLVYTNEGLKEIGDIVAGDRVITEDGSVQRVLCARRTPYQGKMMSISIGKNGTRKIQVTPEHPFLVIREQEQNFLSGTLRKRLDKKLVSTEWVEAEVLTRQDLIAFPIFESSVEEDDSRFDEDDCFFYGLMIGNGDSSNEKEYFNISFRSKKDDEQITFCREYMESRNIQFVESTGKSSPECPIDRHFTWSEQNNFIMGRELFFNERHEKRIHPTMLKLSMEKSFEIIHGLLVSNAFRVSTNENSADNDIIVTTKYQYLVRVIQFLFMKYGIPAQECTRDFVINQKNCSYSLHHKQNTWSLSIPKIPDVLEWLKIENSNPENLDTSFFYYNNCYFARVNEIKSIKKYEGDVVDLEIENVHSYLTEIGVAHNGGGKRKGAFSIYLEPWHADIYDFLELKKNTGKEERRARDLFYALWINDLFMERVRKNEKWSLFCPSKAKGLHEVHGEEFRKLYEKYEQERRFNRQVDAQHLWMKIIESQVETGVPYMLYKDSANFKSNQRNLGTIQSSNLCTEIIEYTSKDEIAVCNLCSIALPKFVVPVNSEQSIFDFDLLEIVVRQCVRNLNLVIDYTHYPLEKCKTSNLRHRPIGIGVQGLADVFFSMRMPFDSEEAKTLNRNIFECMYYAAVDESCALAQRNGAYETFQGSPLSEGLFQFDLWRKNNVKIEHSGRYDWPLLRTKVMRYGVRNSLLMAPMPTATTAQILGNTESCEPLTSNLYVRRVLGGDFLVVNKYLIEDLRKLKLWDERMRNTLTKERGSVQRINAIPDKLKSLYRTVWEISQKHIIDMAAERGVYICQSQSMNVHMASPTTAKLNAMHFYGWEKGLKTGMYYLRTKPATNAVQFTVDDSALYEIDESMEMHVPAYSEPGQENNNKKNILIENDKQGEVCRMEEGCVSCGS